MSSIWNDENCPGYFGLQEIYLVWLWESTWVRPYELWKRSNLWLIFETILAWFCGICRKRVQEYLFCPVWLHVKIRPDKILLNVMYDNVFWLALLSLFNRPPTPSSIHSIQNGVMDILSPVIPLQTVILIGFLSKLYVWYFRYYILHLRVLLCRSTTFARWRALFFVHMSWYNTSTANKDSNGLWHSR